MQHVITALRTMPAATPATAPVSTRASRTSHTTRASTLQLALQAAIAARHTGQLHTLLQQHGPDLFAHALVALTQRQQADVLSLLAAQERAEVYRHLPAHARRQWLQSATVARPPLRRRLLCACQRNWHWLRATLRSSQA
ncbi:MULTISPECIES: hypothetical protein [Delftia]|uniref:Magnesium transporter MgtE intracellular domain-containing protein n=1 Tax=Delftia tsuruhatensis TaxID=180282 RepID=A0ABN4SLR9_9BURK|nr:MULTISPECIES: hypothetical protein [Delftia]AOV03187.1 hypothetical protein BI380_18455 [Delftia tsuruhatensis]KLO60440.1 hypothetical protein AA671_05370 [Delftia tsuruhatensis]MCO5335486.1 hypothetical protein [Delftia tsuruhatensis]MCR4547490.1 hypothetical protein [Delftia tsuruhatensis]MDH2229879.1 hypothetical protein [Delftia tsuruhatensis]